MARRLNGETMRQALLGRGSKDVSRRRNGGVAAEPEQHLPHMRLLARAMGILARCLRHRQERLGKSVIGKIMGGVWHVWHIEDGWRVAHRAWLVCGT